MNIFLLLGNIDFLVNKNAPRGNTLVRKEVTKVTRTRRGCFAYAKHFLKEVKTWVDLKVPKLRKT